VVVKEPRPGRIRAIVPTDIPHQRNRASAEFIERKERVLRELSR